MCDVKEFSVLQIWRFAIKSIGHPEIMAVMMNVHCSWCCLGVEHMTNLEEFWANNNSVEDFKEVKRILDLKL